MNQKLLTYLKRFIDFLQKEYDKSIVKKEILTQPYYSLSPVTDNTKENQYCEALLWALKNKKEEDIKNIALTGPYGSGKSSILKTFQAKHKHTSEFKFLNISLATFKEEKNLEIAIVEGKKSLEISTVSSVPHSNQNDLLRLIELSILQQIFYHTSDKEIPESRFRKIKHYTWIKKIIYTFLIILFLIECSYLWNTKQILDLIKLEWFTFFNSSFYHPSLLVALCGFFYIGYKSISRIGNLKISKLNFNNNIEFSNEDNKSILNNHLDEILYFFEATKKNVVIIEDLDRFEHPEIYTKLRELNFLINNYINIKDVVVFVYAVRDDMFNDTNRTKFFDFIIPVVPVIDFSNSSGKLKEALSEYTHDLPNELIEDMSLFIDDMRLLYNIVNEFKIYIKNLNPEDKKNLKPEYILPLIVYKNLLPNDFTKLSKREGDLFKCIDSKKSYIQQEIKRIEKKESEHNEKLEKLKSLKITNIKELRKLYLFQYATVYNRLSISFNGNGRYLNALLDDEVLFENFRLGNPNQHGGYEFRFTDIEKAVDPNHGYLEREKQINDFNNAEVEILKKRIEELEVEKINLNLLRLKEILNKGHNIDVEDKKNSQILNIFLRNGYIDEDYHNYISVFIEGSLSINDREFVLNVKSNMPTDFSFKLQNIENVIGKIYINSFQQNVILNYDLLSFLLGRESNYTKQLEKIFGILTNESNYTLQFIDGFILEGFNITKFIKILCNKWINIWSFIESHPTLTEAKKEQYLMLIIQYANIADLKVISNHSPTFNDNILAKRDFLTSVKSIERLKEVIENLNLKFYDLDINEIPEELFNFIYEGNWYKINQNMIEIILKYKNLFNSQEFEKMNYFSIRGTNCEKLIEYIEKDIITYIKDVYLTFEENQEPETTLIQLLKKKEISIVDKGKIIRNTTTIISDLNDIDIDIDSIKLDEILLEEFKVKPTWGNIYSHYLNTENQFSDSLVKFLNKLDNAESLSLKKIDIENTEENKEFQYKLITENKISDKCYTLLLKSVSLIFDELDSKELSFEKARLLIENKIVTLNVKSYNSLKESFAKLIVLFIESQVTNFLEDITDFSLDEKDIVSILKSKVLNHEELKEIVKFTSQSVLYKGIEYYDALGILLIDNDDFEVNVDFVNQILTKSQLSTEQKIKLFINYISLFSKKQVLDFLDLLPTPYSDIAVNYLSTNKKRKKISISNSELNVALIQNLINLGLLDRQFKEDENFIYIFVLKNS